MILAERLCLFGFDPQGGGERPQLDRDTLHAAMAGLMLTDLVCGGRFAIVGDRIEQLDTLPLAHPLLTEAATLLSRLKSTALASALQQLRAASPRWHGRMRKALAERGVLELWIPFPFLRRYRLRSRQAWNESAHLLDAAMTDAPMDRMALAFATHRCGWLADTVSSDVARQLLARIDAVTRSDDVRLRQLPSLFAHA